MGKTDMNVMMGTKVPALRFNGFDDEWVEKKLGDLLVERNDKIPENEDYPLMSFVQGLGVVPKSDRYDRGFLVKNPNKKYKKTKKGDYIYSSNNLETGSIGFNTIGNAVISPVYSIFKSKSDLESNFIGLISGRNDFINKMIRYRQGVMYGQWRIHESDFLNIDQRTPSSTEQSEIVSMFKTADALIQSEEQKLEQLQSLKKSFLQKMFPKKGATVPELRFEGFSGDWTEKKLGDVGEFKTSSVNKKIVKGELMVNLLNYMDVYNQRNVCSNNVSTLQQTSAKEAQIKNNNLLRDDVLFTPSSETPEDIGHSMVISEDLPNTVYSYHLVRFRPATRFNSEYLNYFANIEPVRQQIVQKATGSTRFTVSLKDFKDIIVMYPSFDEQQAIGQFFKTFDELIAKQEEKVENGKLLKKALLQKMFV